jgi:hypothetical protein
MTVRIMTGHVMDVLRQIENESVHCPQYAAMADRRLRDDAGMFASIAAE